MGIKYKKNYVPKQMSRSSFFLQSVAYVMENSPSVKDKIKIKIRKLPNPEYRPRLLGNEPEKALTKYEEKIIGPKPN